MGFDFYKANDNIYIFIKIFIYTALFCHFQLSEPGNGVVGDRDMGEKRDKKNLNSIRFLDGDCIYLRPHELENVDNFYKWFNDPEIRRLIGEVYPLSKIEAKEKFESWIKEKNSVSLSIMTKKDNKWIGIIGLININNAHRHAEIGIVIGEKDYWSKGYGREAIKLILNYGFNRLNLHRIYLGMIDYNTRAKKAYKSLGFVQEGILREKFYIDGNYYDGIVMSILRKEWEKWKN